MSFTNLGVYFCVKIILLVFSPFVDIAFCEWNSLFLFFDIYKVVALFGYYVHQDIPKFTKALALALMSINERQTTTDQYREQPRASLTRHSLLF